LQGARPLALPRRDGACRAQQGARPRGLSRPLARTGGRQPGGSEGGFDPSRAEEGSMRNRPPPFTPPHKGEGDSEALTSPSPLWGGVKGGGDWRAIPVI